MLSFTTITGVFWLRGWPLIHLLSTGRSTGQAAKGPPWQWSCSAKWHKVHQASVPGQVPAEAEKSSYFTSFITHFRGWKQLLLLAHSEAFHFLTEHSQKSSTMKWLLCLSLINCPSNEFSVKRLHKWTCLFSASCLLQNKLIWQLCIKSLSYSLWTRAWRTQLWVRTPQRQQPQAFTAYSYAAFTGH